MKFDKLDFATRNRKPRKPLLTLRELAEEFGISYGSLVRYAAIDKTFPDEKLHHHPRCGYGGKHPNFKDRWYEPGEVRRWWKNHNEKLKGESKC